MPKIWEDAVKAIKRSMPRRQSLRGGDVVAAKGGRIEAWDARRDQARGEAPGKMSRK